MTAAIYGFYLLALTCPLGNDGGPVVKTTYCRHYIAPKMEPKYRGCIRRGHVYLNSAIKRGIKIEQVFLTCLSVPQKGKRL